jgi:hypothetical protein
MALFDTNEGGGLFDSLPNIFMTPDFAQTGILTDEQQKGLRNQATKAGLLGTALTYFANPQNQNYGSIVPYLAKAGLGGMGAAQDVYGSGLTNLYRQKLLESRQTENPLEIERLVNLRDKLKTENPNNPNIAIYDDIIQNKRTPKEGLNINLGQPMTAINPRTGKEELVQFPNKPGEKPIFTGLQKPEPELKLKAIPSGPATAYAENNTAMKSIDDAIAKVEAAPDNSFGVQNYLPGAITQRIDKPGIDARAAVAAIGSKKYHDLSGAAVTITEAPRMAPFIPSSTDTKDKILQNLKNIKTQYEDTNNSLSSVYNEEQGYRPLNVKPASSTQPQQQTTEPKQSQSVPKAPKVGQVMNGYKFKGGNPADKNNWEKM